MGTQRAVEHIQKKVRKVEEKMNDPDFIRGLLYDHSALRECIAKMEAFTARAPCDVDRRPLRQNICDVDFSSTFARMDREDEKPLHTLPCRPQASTKYHEIFPKLPGFLDFGFPSCSLTKASGARDG